MKQFLLSLLVAILSVGFVAGDAEARRLGGGGSFGMKRNVAPKQAPAKPAAAPTAPGKAANATPPKRSSWMGPIAGLAAGLGLAALFSHLGLGEELASVVMLLLLVAAAVFIFRALGRRRQAGSTSSAMQYATATSPVGHRDATPAPVPPVADSGAASQLAQGFDAAAFAREAKVNFIRLQAANDAGNLDDLRQFTTPEVFAELALQLKERDGQAQQTDILKLDAEVLDVAEEGGRYIVSVRYHGLIREQADAMPEQFAEIWHLAKPVQGGDGWRIAGIEQVH